MFTSRSKRDSCYIGKSDVPPHLGPGYYNTDTSTLWRSAYTGQAPFQTTAANDDTFDQELKRASSIPAPGAYDTYNTPVYIRGAIQEHSSFASTVPRFKSVQNDVPSPSQYRNIQPDLSKAGHTANVRRKKLQIQKALKAKAEQQKSIDMAIQSIPYKAKQIEKPIARTGRDAWIADTALNMIENPGPGTYIEREEFVPAVPASTRKKDKSNAALIPVGGASSSIAKPSFLPKMKKMRSFPYAGTNWVRARGRDPLFDIDPSIKIGPGDYTLYKDGLAQSIDFTKPSPMFASAVDRFAVKYDKDLLEIAPNTYKVEDIGSISQRQNELRQQTELRQEVKRSLQKAIKLSEKLHPSVALVEGESGGRAASLGSRKIKNLEKLPPFLSMEEKTRVANPPVGQYNAPASKFDKIVAQNNVTAFGDNDISMLAVNRLALRQTFGIQKWPETASSIPEKVIADEEPAQVEEEKLLPYGIGNPPTLSAIRAGTSNATNVTSFAKATDREKMSHVSAMGKEKEHLGPGSYEDMASYSSLAKKHDFSTTLSGPFASTVPRNMIHKDAERKLRDETLAAENQQRYAEISAEKRAMGGSETAVNFAKARYDGATDMDGKPKKMYNNSATDRNTTSVMMAQFDMSVPGVAVYNTATERRQNAIKLYAHDRVQTNTSLPESLRPEIAGPSATKAAKVLLEERTWTAPGPGHYSSESTLIKRSFNVLAEDNL